MTTETPWQVGRSVGFTSIATLAGNLVDDIYEFLDHRHARRHRFVAIPIVSESEWLGYYSSYSNFLIASITALFPMLAEPIKELRGRDNLTAEEKQLLVTQALALFSSQNTEEVHGDALGLEDHEDWPVFNDVELPGSISFALYVALPCWLVHGETVHGLLIQAASKGKQASKAVERLIRLDPRVTQHPRIRKWVREGGEGTRSYRENRIGKWTTLPPYNRVSKTAVLVRISAVLMRLSKIYGEDLSIPELQRLLMKTLQSGEAKEYLLDRTVDDFRREVARKSEALAWPPLPDEKELDAVRALRDHLA